VIMAITIWEWTGVTFVLYYAAMSQVDPEILEAARIDGAGNIRTLLQIVWPNVRGTTVALAMLSVIGALKTFDVPYLVTIGGPNYATEFLGTFIYRISIPSAHVGYGAALSVVLLILALVGSITIGVRAARRDRAPNV
jgi:raffinose/stachyose/melibiose transport system permease protein